MLYPSIDKIMTKVDSKYSLVVAASRRARQLREGSETELQRAKSHKYVGVALEEIYGDYIRLEARDENEVVEEQKGKRNL
ncbi:DNA-directed RNA polymerase subunit omega [Saccharibacillus sp. CPCC 101409]|uniref:DNA-directed RNA polymerase subunit omega n=1 Tax=Saccharibacillus sp. CPCC 101409 TaxID=3058041 RepID=UPI002672C8C8|nr:DNA-directed RNA polymerase subunit omega [Saccharibacillus sp. CPCC 101409]MDO3409373.1 DNA-directed RNA polymerase subunit omega [Saccharibacillus sp. CPCC 101409]